MRLVTFDRGRVGHVDGDEIAVLDVPSTRAWFERGGADETGERVPLAEAARAHELMGSPEAPGGKLLLVR